MKVYLINPDYMIYGYPPLGLAYLAAYVRDKIPAIEIKILDQIPYKKIMQIIEKEKPEIVGLTSVSQNWAEVKKLAESINVKSKNTKLIIGGVHITTFPSCFKDSVFHYGILGEGEFSFTELLNLILIGKDNSNNIKNIKGVIFREGNNIINTGRANLIQNLDTIPPPALDLLNMDYYSLPKLSSGFREFFLVFSSRGCPYSCKFCSSSSFWGRQARFFSVDRFINEIEILYTKYHFNLIDIGDDLFSINESRLEKIILGLKKKNLLGRIEFICTARANIFNESIAKLLKELGVKSISFGFESGSDKMLKWLKMGTIGVETNKVAIKICKKYNLQAFGFFMIGSPHETINDSISTYNFIKDYCKDSFAIYQTLPYPGTEVWDYAVKEGIINTNFYEFNTREFIEADYNHLLTKEMSIEQFLWIWEKIQRLKVRNMHQQFFKTIRKIQFKNLITLFSIIFIKKVWNFKYKIIKRRLY